jgi:hypothetical protein
MLPFENENKIEAQESLKGIVDSIYSVFKAQIFLSLAYR